MSMETNGFAPFEILSVPYCLFTIWNSRDILLQKTRNHARGLQEELKYDKAIEQQFYYTEVSKQVSRADVQASKYRFWRRSKKIQ